MKNKDICERKKYVQDIKTTKQASLLQNQQKETEYKFVFPS